MRPDATEDPTPRRRAEARRRGQVAHSPQLRGAAALAATFLALVALAPSMVGQLTRLFTTALSRAPRGAPLGEAARLGFDTGVRVLALPVATAFALTLAVGLLQTGGLWVAAAPRPDLGRLSPSRALRRLWGRRPLDQAGTAILEIAIIAGVAALSARAWLPLLAHLAGGSAARVLEVTGAIAQRLGGRVVVAVLLIGVAHELWARRRHDRALRMTRREVLRERKELEGDPAQRAERRRLYREMGTSSAIADVGRADMVITGAGAQLVAVALSYDGAGHRAGRRAPVVVAHGQRQVAARIVDAARSAHVPVFPDAALAEELRALAEGDEIPPASYDRVAELLRIAYQRRGTGGRGSQ